MPMQRFPDEPVDKQFFVLLFDQSPAEVDDPDLEDERTRRYVPGSQVGGNRMSDCIVQAIADAHAAGTPYTDVFLICHGWLNDLDSACQSYDRWIQVVHDAQPAQADRIPSVYRPLVIALHWPSKPSTIWHRSDGLATPFEFWAKAASTRRTSDSERPGFLACAAAVLPPVSFYAMKELAGVTGREAVAPVLARLQRAAAQHAPEGGHTRFHLMGHSFGAKLVSELLVDEDRHGVDPVESMFLIEGAMSTWGFAERDPYRNRPGLGRAVWDRHRVEGVAVASTSSHDWALRYSFPTAQLISDVVRRFARGARPATGRPKPGQAPRFGALGRWGFSGVDLAGTVTLRTAMRLGLRVSYGFRKGWYHLDTDAVVTTAPIGPGQPKNDRPFLGAHSAINRPEVAHAYWQVVFPDPSEAAPAPRRQEQPIAAQVPTVTVPTRRLPTSADAVVEVQRPDGQPVEVQPAGE